MQTLEWIELACVHVLRTGKKGRCYVLISSIWQKMHAWLHSEKPPPAFSPLRLSTCSLPEVAHARKTASLKRCNHAEIFNIFWQLSAADLCVLLVLIYMKVLNSYFFFLLPPPLFFFLNSLLSHFWFSDGQLAGDSWAYFHLPNTKTALGPPCSSLIIHIQARASWQVCWSHSMFCDLDNTFSLCGQKMLRPSHFLRPVLWDSTEAEARNYSSSVRVMLVSGSGWSQISRQSNRDWVPEFSIPIWAKHCFI